MAVLGVCLLLTVVSYLVCVLPLPILCDPLTLRETAEACASANFRCSQSLILP